MATYTVQKLPDEPIVIFANGADFQIKTELIPAIIEIKSLLDCQSTPVYLVNDLTDAPAPSPNEIMNAATHLAIGADALYQHPKIKCIIAITPFDVIRMAYGEMLRSLIHNRDIQIFRTLAEGLAYARTHQ